MTKLRAFLSFIVLMSLGTYAYADLDCFPIPDMTNAELKELINQNSPVYEERFNKRKTLYIYEAESVSATGCNISVTFRAKLARKIRRDAVGTIDMKGTVSRLSGCIVDAEVTKTRLSYTTGLGEAFYKIAANNKLPSSLCLGQD